MLSSPGLRHLNHLKIGLDELQWGQAYAIQVLRENVLAGLHRYGLLLSFRPNGLPDDAWALLDQGNGRIKLGRRTLPPGGATGQVRSYAVDGNGKIMGYGPDFDFDPGDIIPDDTTWYTVVVSAFEDEYEPGTLQVFAGTPNVTGTGTKFTRLSGYTTDGYNRGSNLRIAAADTVGGNAGTYEVDTILSDTSLTLKTNIAGANEAGIPFTIAGDFLGASPADPDIHRHVGVSVAVVAGPLRETGDKTRLILGDVRRTGIALEIVDRRTQHMAVALPDHQRSYELTKRLRCDTASAIGLEADIWLLPMAINAAANAVASGVPNQNKTAAWGMLYAWDDVAPNLRSQCVDAPSRATTITSAVVDAGAPPGVHPTMVRLPFGNRVVCIYTRSGLMYQRLSTDDGATWGAEATVWDPTVVDPLDTVDHPHAILVDNHRVLVAAEYYDDSAGATTYIAAIYSDDYASGGVGSWATNGGAGYRISDIAAAGDRLRPYLVQGRNRFLVCLSEDVATLGIVVDVTSSALGISAWTEWPAIFGSSFYDPCGWISQDGHLHVVVVDAVAASYVRLGYYVLSLHNGAAIRENSNPEWIRVESGGAVVVVRDSPFFVQADNGCLFLVFVDHTAGRLRTIEVTPVLRDRMIDSGAVRNDL